MNFQDEKKLARELNEDSSKRDRAKFDYTVDALEKGGIMPGSIWPDSNKRVAGVVKGTLDYNSLPVDELNEYHKGGLFSEQQDIILRNNGKEPLCEALDMQPCLKDKCELYKSNLGPPVCGEYKMAFRR